MANGPRMILNLSEMFGGMLALNRHSQGHVSCFSAVLSWTSGIPAWEHSEAQYVQIFSPSLQNNEVTVITSIDISFGYQRRSRPGTSVPLRVALLSGYQRSSICFRLLCALLPSFCYIGWVVGTIQPFTATALPLVIAHTGSPFLSLSPSPISSGCPKAFASLQAPPLPFLFCSPIPHWSRLTPLNFQSPVSQPFLCVPAFSFSFNWLFLLFFSGNVLFALHSSWVVSNAIVCICQSYICPLPILHPNGFHFRRLLCVMLTKTWGIDVALSV